MPLIKMATAARRARMGSTNTIARALRAAGVPLATLSPGVFAVEEEDLNRFLRNREEEKLAPPPPVTRPKPSGTYSPPITSEGRPKRPKRRQ
jgi:hypothetical protein